MALILSMAAVLAGCSNTVSWKEEVKLKDGRVIVAAQKKRCEGGDYNAKTNATCVAREAWLTLNLPEFSNSEIVWHESLDPMVVNIHEGRLYVIGFPPHAVEFRAYGATNPPYIGFLWDKGTWKRIPFRDIPEAIYEGNMLIESIPKHKTDFLNLPQKISEAENGDPRYPSFLRRIDPKYTAAAY
jgi:hypothetical protein